DLRSDDWRQRKTERNAPEIGGEFDRGDRSGDGSIHLRCISEMLGRNPEVYAGRRPLAPPQRGEQVPARRLIQFPGPQTRMGRAELDETKAQLMQPVDRPPRLAGERGQGWSERHVAFIESRHRREV